MAATASKLDQSLRAGCCCSSGSSPNAGPAHSHGKEAPLSSAVKESAHGGHMPRATSSEGVRDPVCGMVVDPHHAEHRHEHKGRTYYFCSTGCRAKFAAEPEKYLNKSEVTPAPVPEGTIYTCPMHPEIRQS